MHSDNYGVERQGKVFAVVNYGNTVTTFSKVLTHKETQQFKETGTLPDGVTALTGPEVLETFNTAHEANNFIKAGCKKKPELHYGVFKSKAQYQLAKKLVAAK